MARAPNNSNGRGGKGPVRVLFLAWGYSIHAVRRIRIFSEDPGFAVAVVSPHDYRFPGARNILLSGESEKAEIAARFSRDRAGSWAGSSRFLRRIDRILCRGRDMVRYVPLLVRLGIADPRTIRMALDSQNVLLELEVGLRDLEILEAAVQEFQPGLIFLQTLLYPCYLSNLLRVSIPRMITFWNGDVTWWAQWSGTERMMKKQIVTHGANRARAVTVNSGAAREACLSYGVRPEKIHVIRYPGVDRTRFARSSRKDARSRLGIGARHVVLCPRGVGGYLNSDVIVAAAPAILSRHPDTLFLVLSRAEDEKDRRDHRIQAEALGVGGSFRWEEHVPWESMPDYYNAADVMISISSNDSLPNCMLEAMACGIPVVMGDIPSIREWITDGGNGFLVPPRDPASLAATVAKILESPGEALEAMTRNGMGQVRRDADGETNARRIKELVQMVAGVSPARI
ncbi:MAG: glycosyltransferase family 4 protein [Desulfobacteria bacterium]